MRGKAATTPVTPAEVPMFETVASIPAGTQMVIRFFLLMAIGVPVAFLGLSALCAMWLIGFGFDLAGDLIASGITQ